MNSFKLWLLTVLPALALYNAGYFAAKADNKINTSTSIITWVVLVIVYAIFEVWIFPKYYKVIERDVLNND